MLGMLKRHEIEVLLKAGHAKIEVARLAGVSLSSVKRIAEEDPVVHVDDTAERGQRRIGRPSIDRKSTRLNSSHGYISYAVFCLKKKKKKKTYRTPHT